MEHLAFLRILVEILELDDDVIVIDRIALVGRFINLLKPELHINPENLGYVVW